MPENWIFRSVSSEETGQGIESKGNNTEDKELELINHLLSGEIPTDDDWNNQEHTELCKLETQAPRLEPTPEQCANLSIVDEGIRDGLHGIPEYPDITAILTYIEKVYLLGVRDITVGIYTGESRINDSIMIILSEMQKNFPDIRPIVLSLTTIPSIEWLARCREKNENLNAIVFRGSAPFRMMVENWTREKILEDMSIAVYTAAHNLDVRVIGATENTTQTPPDFLKDIIEVQATNGAQIFCIADTIGTARMQGAHNIVRFVKSVLYYLKANGKIDQDVLIDWHGHMDLGLGTANALVAAAAGANRIHTVCRGIGERAGNVPMEEILLSLYKITENTNAQLPWNLKMLVEVLESYNEMTRVPVRTHGAMGSRAWDTSLGIHTAAMEKGHTLVERARQEAGESVDIATSQQYQELATKLEQMVESIYSSVNPHIFGAQHRIHIGPWSGRSSVKVAYRQYVEGNPNLLKKFRDIDADAALSWAKIIGKEMSQEYIRAYFQSIIERPD